MVTAEGPRLRELDVVIFDVDDTLVRTFETGLAKLRLVERELGLAPIAFARYRELYGRLSFESCLRAWYPSVDRQHIARHYRSLRSRVPCRPICSLAPLRSVLADYGITVGVLSNGLRADIAPKLAAVDADVSELHFVLGAEDLPAPKPNPKCFLPVLALTGVAPGRHLYVGDSEPDRAAAWGAGLRFLGVCTGARPWEENPHHPTVPSIAELLPVLINSL